MPALWHYCRRIPRAVGPLLPVCVGKSNHQHKGFPLYHPFVWEKAETAQQLEDVLILCSVLHDKLTEQRWKVQGLQAATFSCGGNKFLFTGIHISCKTRERWSHCDRSSFCYSSPQPEHEPQGVAFCCSLDLPCHGCSPATIKAMCSSLVLCYGPTW